MWDLTMTKWSGKERDLNLFSLSYIWMKGKAGVEEERHIGKRGKGRGINGY